MRAGQSEVRDAVTSRERVSLTLEHRPVDRAPRDLWTLPGVVWFRRDELEAVQRRFPSDFAVPDYRYGAAERARGEPCRRGQYVDAWGCVWHVAEDGVVGEVKEPAIRELSDIASYRPPFELLDGADLSRVDRSCAETDLFTRVGTETRPFERLQFLRGTEQLLMDLAYGEPAIEQLLRMVHDFFCREMEMWAATDVDGVQFMDDWGSQTALLISPRMWRETFKPLYRDYCSILKSRGKRVFFHSDGNIEEIIPDLIEIGVDALNSQLFCMDIEKLGELYLGRITFWGEIDRQQVLSFGTPDDVRAAVRRVRAALDRGQGGVIAQCEWGLETPRENIEAVFEEWEKPL